MSFPEYPTITRQLPARQLASFPATGPLGWITLAWLWWLKRHLNRARYKLTLKGRAAKRPELRGYGGSIKLKNARKWGLYIDDKMGGKLSEYSRAIGVHQERGAAEQARREAAYNSRELEAVQEVCLADRRKLEQTRDELAAVKLAATRDQLEATANREALNTIYRLMDGTEWDSETTSNIGEILHGLGFKIRDPNDLDADHLADGKAGHPAEDPEALDEQVHEAKSAEAARINNQGSEAQRAYIDGQEGGQ